MAFGVKAVVLVLGAGGLATMWEAVFAEDELKLNFERIYREVKSVFKLN